MEMRDLARKLTIFVILIGIGLFTVGLLQDFSITISLVYALGVAMAVVPQALPAQVTVALTTCSSRLAARNAVIKNLPSVETLGSTTIICTDKTGTLTKNEMTIRSVWFNETNFKISGTGYKPKGDIRNENDQPLTPEELSSLEVLTHTAIMASNAEIHDPDDSHPDWYPIGDPTEAAIVSMAIKLGFPSPAEDCDNPKIQEFPFDSKGKLMSSVHRSGNAVHLAVKGSLEGVYWPSANMLPIMAGRGPLPKKTERVYSEQKNVIRRKGCECLPLPGKN
jgi:Ca2+-transporting ATPase